MGVESLKREVVRLLTTAGVYPPLRSSVLFDAYLRRVHPETYSEKARELDFYGRAIGPVSTGSLVFDIGANIGDKADVFRRIVDKVICLEPDVASARFLRQRFRRSSNVVVVEQAVSDREHEVQFRSFGGLNAFNTLSDKWAREVVEHEAKRSGLSLTAPRSYGVTAVSLDQLIDQFGIPSYVKIDVEGHEPSVLKGLTREVPLLSFEANLPAFRAEALECVAHLASISPDARFNFAYGPRSMRFERPWAPAAEFSGWLAETSELSVDVFFDSRSLSETATGVDAAALAS